jgi:crossover junction endodeoxyribonuclease RusA
MRVLRFAAVGKPVAQGSKRHVGNGVMIEMGKGHKEWRTAVTAAVIMAADESLAWDEPWDAAVTVDLTFYFTRPKSHYRTGRYAHLLRADAPREHETPPDIDKLCRAVLDSMTDAGVFTSDARVSRLAACKKYADDGRKPGVVVAAWETR